MGTPVFARTILHHLIENKQKIVGIVTAPDKPLGRGLKVGESAVKQYAKEYKIPVLQPNNLKDDVFLQDLRALSADLFIVVAFRMLPKVVWNMPPKGTINLHASLLPNFRGAAPIHWAIIQGAKKTGVSTFFIEQEIDTGQIIEQESIPIAENETTGELHDRLMILGAKVTLSTVLKIEQGTVKSTPQANIITENIHTAPKLYRATCQINFDQSVQNVHNFVRGLSPYPAAWCLIDHPIYGEKTIKFFQCQISQQPSSPNDPIISSVHAVLFPCSDFYLSVTELQVEGKRKMTVKEYLVGNTFENWTIKPTKAE